MTDMDAPTYLEVRPPLGPPDALLVGSPSKSATHRAILMGTLTPHTVIENALLSADTAASLRLASALGARTGAEPVSDAGRRLLGRIGAGIEPVSALRPEDHAGGDHDVPPSWSALLLSDVLGGAEGVVPRPLLAAQVRLHVEGPKRLGTDGAHVDLGNSGTTLRLGTALAALGSAAYELTGDHSLLTRPMAPLVDALGALGATVSAEGTGGRPPIHVRGPLRPGTTQIRGDVSSQFTSALLLAAQGVDGRVRIEVSTPLKSAPYVALTVGALGRFGGRVDESAGAADAGPVFTVDGPVAFSPVRYFVPGDWSSAAFLFVAAAVTGGRVTLAGMDATSEQGDKAVLGVMEQTGCSVEWADDPERPGGRLVTVTAPAGPLRPFTHAFTQTPDLFPPLAALAARCAGRSSLVDAAHVRVKECDRLAAMAAGLGALDVAIEEEDDALHVHGSAGAPVMPSRIEAHDDHRILMAFAMLALAGPGPLYITDPGCYHVSYPRFRMDVDALGGETRVVDHETMSRATTPDASAAHPQADSEEDAP